MLTIIHGDDIAASRKYFTEARDKEPDAQIVDGEKVSLTDLAQLLEGGGLFAETKTIFIEQFFARKKKKEEFAALSSYLEKNAESNTTIIWEGKELDRSSLGLLKTATPRLFKLPQTLFLFLDSLKPGNGKQLISLFHQTIETTEAEMVFFMLVRQVRLLLAVSGGAEGEGTPIDEIKRMQPWQRSKLEKQAKLFSPEQLITLHNNLFSLELGQKTGTLSNTILTSVDFLLLEI